MLFVAWTNAGVFDIGDFVSESDARQWAEARFGSDLIEVGAQPTTSVTVTPEPETNWLLWAGLAVGAFFLFSKKGG
jgi:hypothetical protein